MLRQETIPRRWIKTDRKLESDDQDWKVLVKDIKANGLKHQILVDDRYNLLDGLRRLQAFGPNDELTVIVSDDLRDTLLTMAEVPEGRTASVTRAWDLEVALVAQAKRYWAQTRTGRGGLKPAQKERVRTRQAMLAKALKRPTHWVQAVMYICKRAHGHIPCPEKFLPLARDLAKRIAEGYNVHSAVLDFHKAQESQQKRIVTERDQRTTLNSVTASLAAIVHTLEDLGPLHPKIKPSEAAEWAETMAKARGAIRRTTATIKERATT